MDESSFEKLAMAELDAVYRLACRLAGGPQAAEDFVQETYLRAFRSSATFTLADHGIRPWLIKILHNVVCNRGASDQRNKALMESLNRELSREPVNNGDADRASDFGTIDWDAIDERLKAAVEGLPIPNRVAFLLSVAEGLKYREIADVTGVAIGTVMSRLYRARAILAAQLTDLAMERRLSRPGVAGKEDDRKHV